MKCPICYEKTRITQTQQIGNKVKRIRKCEGCLSEIPTYEKADLSLVDLEKLQAEARERK